MDTPTSTPPPVDLPDRLSALTLRDERRLRRRLDGLGKLTDPQRRAAAEHEFDGDLQAAEQRIARRRAAAPTVGYPQHLPVAARRDDLLAAIRDHQVVVVAGETGSGKTTQLPKMCLELGRGVRGLIGHTQPRRIAARSVAERIAEELGTDLGGAVGYSVRFTDRIGDDTLIRVMTDGILLAEIQRDPMLLRYDTLIVDEAHERSLTIDFLLGYLRQLLPRRPDLKLVITSATIDPQRFADHFDGAPVVEVSGRTYPVEIRYRPLVDDGDDDERDERDERAPGTGPADPGEGGPAGRPREDRDQVQGICDAVAELGREAPGDVLVFLSGEREIRDAADALARLQLRDTEIVPLYARLSAAEQHRVFAPHRGRRIVLATNVAETSLTVPGIRYVVDTGTARISRYSQRTKVQRLPFEPVSRASADQRAGRCGRLSDGICIRLYSRRDYESRPRFTEPEILRTNLASVILRMTALGLGDLSAFPFVDPPDQRQVKDGVALLQELGALAPEGPDRRRRLTATGRLLADLPVDPRLARMLVEADRNGCLAEVLVIVSALSIQDPRERPAEQQAQADQQHARFAEPGSDFLAYLNLWQYLRERQDELSSSAFRRLCKAEFLHYLRVREWQDLHAQLRQVLRQAGVEVPRELAEHRPADAIHLSLLAGLLSHVGVREGESREFLGARGSRFVVAPGSSLSRKPPRWVMVAELVETSRLFARVAARVEPEWVERLAGHLVKRSYSEPRWERKRASVVATERVTLYGMPVVTARTVGYGAIDPELSRDLFLRHALVEGDWRTDHRFFHENRRLLDDVEDLENRARRRDIVVDDQALFDFYDARVPEDVVSGAHFDQWWKRARRQRPDLLSFWTSMLVSDTASRITAEDYPDTWHEGDLALPLTYQFEPGTAADGVTVHVPLAVLNRVPAQAFEWQIPGLREELLTALIRGLPKAVRRHLAPAPDHARAALARLRPGSEPLLPALSRALAAIAGVDVPVDAWEPARLPDHLRVTFRVTGDDGRTLAEGKDLAALVARLRPQQRAAVARAAPEVERDGLTSWTVGDLPRHVERVVDGAAVRGWPALVDRGDRVAVQVFTSPGEQRRAMATGTRRLLLLQVPSPARTVLGGLDRQQKLALAAAPHGSASALFDDCLAAAVDALVEERGGPVWDAGGFAALLAHVRGGLPERAATVTTTTAAVLGAAREVDRGLRSTSSPVLLPALADLRGQLDQLVHPGFVTATGAQRLPDLLRYVQAMQRRLEKLPERPDRDRAHLETVRRVQAEYDHLLATLPAERREADDVRRIRWLVEELRVSLFGAGLRTAQPVSEQRILRAIDDAAAT